MHQDQIYRKSMKPCRKGGFSAEAADLAEEVEEGLLGHVFCFGDVTEHAEAQSVDTSFVEGIKLRKCFSVSVLCCFDRFCFAGDGGIALKDAGSGCILGH